MITTPVGQKWKPPEEDSDDEILDEVSGKWIKSRNWDEKKHSLKAKWIKDAVEESKYVSWYQMINGRKHIGATRQQIEKEIDRLGRELDEDDLENMEQEYGYTSPRPASKPSSAQKKVESLSKESFDELQRLVTTGLTWTPKDLPRRPTPAEHRKYLQSEQKKKDDLEYARAKLSHEKIQHNMKVRTAEKVAEHQLKKKTTFALPDISPAMTPLAEPIKETPKKKRPVHTSMKFAGLPEMVL